MTKEDEVIHVQTFFMLLDLIQSNIKGRQKEIDDSQVVE